eukprot:TRINITY_DN51485_c0_g1_i1.p1 TRINITY_DN51485_c0_g1~~TRINITY_DN51485_c0_g1_i1.p1  ORF type:complete len:162 (+),score=7.94 TRINITY_DN51485_c0_g1_i1:50-487(+)
MLLLVSITDWCTQGNLFASSCIVAYSIWLSYLAVVTIQPDYSKPLVAVVLEIALVFVVLAASLFGTQLDFGEERMLGATENAATSKSICLQALLHAFAAAYVLTALALSADDHTVVFVCRITSVFGSLAVYAWMLVAPKLMPSRF